MEKNKEEGDEWSVQLISGQFLPIFLTAYNTVIESQRDQEAAVSDQLK